MSVLQPNSSRPASRSSLSIGSLCILNLHDEKPVTRHLDHFSADPVIRSLDRLPDELLSCIFTYVIRAESYPIGTWFRSGAEWLRLMSPPITLSHVCSDWHRIAIHSSTLWRRIYIHTELFDDPRRVALLEAYMARSGQNLLDICILDSPRAIWSNPSPDWPVNDHFFEFLGSALTRARSLILKSSGGIFSEGHPRSTLATCLEKCIPGILVDLIVEVAAYDYPVSRMPDMSLDLPRSKLEELWPSISFLRLDGYYPYAINTSNLKSTQGFTELRLKGWHPITESVLIGILAASPRLRVLEVSTDIIGSLSKGPLIEPIYLNDLEIVKSVITNRPQTHQRQLRILLRLLQPGSKPLSLCISNPNQGPDVPFVCQPEVQAFLDRANVRQLCVYDLERRTQVVELLKLIPSVRALAVSALRSLKPDVNTLHMLSPLDSICVIPWFLPLLPGSIPHPSSDWLTVEWLAETYKPRKLTVWSKDFEFGYSEWDESGKSIIPDNFYTVCPIVNVMAQEEPNPDQEWC